MLQSWPFHSGSPWDILKHNLGCLKIIFLPKLYLNLILLKLSARFWALVKAGTEHKQQKLHRFQRRFGNLELRIELRNQVKQNDVTLPVINSKIFAEAFFWVTNLTSQNFQFHFELLTRRFNFYFFTFELLTQSCKIKFHFELLTLSWKIKGFTSSY